MTSLPLSAPQPAAGKALSGITGLDDMTRGGLPQGRTTMLVGGAGSGKTVLSLQFLINGARNYNEPGIFVAFEESSQRIMCNAESFGWGLAQLEQEHSIYLMNAQPPPDLILSGNFDLCGMLAVLDGQIKAMKVKRIVIDALDIVLALMPDSMSKRREIYRLHDWLLLHGLTAIITAKAGSDPHVTLVEHTLAFMQFMVDCSILLNHGVVHGVSQRNIWIQKYRGALFDENESPFLITKNGVEVAYASSLCRSDLIASPERVSSGVGRLDTMLGGGYFRGASVLITGCPGTAKTTLSGAFAEAACARGERTMFVSFDTDGAEIVRNLNSVGIRLQRYVESGMLRVISAHTVTGSAEMQLGHIKMLSDEHEARCLVIDPVSTLSKSGNEQTAQSVAARLIDWAKKAGATLVCTSLLDEMASPNEGGSPLQISTLTDTWIHLNYLVQGGERNRGLSIIKSRGTSHSNQVRELILSANGITLADAYTAGGEVLMGTMRWAKESSERVAVELADVAARLKKVQLDADEAELEVRLKSLQTKLLAKQTEKALLDTAHQSRQRELKRGRCEMAELRGADATHPPGGAP